MPKRYRRVRRKKSSGPRRYRTKLPSSKMLGLPYKHISLVKRGNVLIRRTREFVSELYPAAQGALLLWFLSTDDGPVVSTDKVNDKVGLYVDPEADYVDSPCARMDGVADYLPTPFATPSGTTTLDVTLRLKPYSIAGGFQNAYGAWSTVAADSCFRFTLSGATINFSVVDGTLTTRGTASALPDAEWVTIRGVLDATGVHLYFNGALVSELLGSFTLNVPATTVTVGKATVGGGYFAGLISEAINICDGVVCNGYKYSNPEGSTEEDVSGNGNHGTWSGTIANIRTTDDGAIPHGIERGFTPYTSSDGSGQRVSSGLTMAEFDRVVFRGLTTAINDHNVFGSDLAPSKTLLRVNASARLGVIDTTGAFNQVGAVTVGDNLPHDIDFTPGGWLVVDGANTVDTSGQTFPASPTYATEIFAFQGGGGLSLNAPYSCKAIEYYNAGVLIKDLRPSLTDPDQMVDILTGTLYPNSGTGTLDQGQIVGMEKTKSVATFDGVSDTAVATNAITIGTDDFEIHYRGRLNYDDTTAFASLFPIRVEGAAAAEGHFEFQRSGGTNLVAVSHWPLGAPVRDFVPFSDLPYFDGELRDYLIEYSNGDLTITIDGTHTQTRSFAPYNGFPLGTPSLFRASKWVATSESYKLVVGGVVAIDCDFTNKLGKNTITIDDESGNGNDLVLSGTIENIWTKRFADPTGVTVDALMYEQLYKIPAVWNGAPPKVLIQDPAALATVGEPFVVGGVAQRIGYADIAAHIPGTGNIWQQPFKGGSADTCHWGEAILYDKARIFTYSELLINANWSQDFSDSCGVDPDPEGDGFSDGFSSGFE